MSRATNLHDPQFLRDPRPRHPESLLHLLRQSPIPPTQARPIPIGPVYVGDADGVREVWQLAPDTEEIRQHLLDIVRFPKEHTDGYPFFASRPHMKAIRQLVDFDDPRVVDALDQRSEVNEGSSFGHT